MPSSENAELISAARSASEPANKPVFSRRWGIALAFNPSAARRATTSSTSFCRVGDAGATIATVSPGLSGFGHFRLSEAAGAPIASPAAPVAPAAIKVRRDRRAILEDSLRLGGVGRSKLVDSGDVVLRATDEMH